MHPLIRTAGLETLTLVSGTSHPSEESKAEEEEELHVVHGGGEGSAAEFLAPALAMEVVKGARNEEEMRE